MIVLFPLCAITVTPFAGVWIEISSGIYTVLVSLSLPSRECGLKSVTADYHTLVKGVTPFAGVWIEMFDI